MSISTTIMASAVAGMFAEAYRFDKERAGFAVGGQSRAGGRPRGLWAAVPEPVAAAKEAQRASPSLALTHASHNGRHSDSQRSAEPTTNTPGTPGSMSSEHSFMATSASAPQPPPLAAQPGGMPPYVPRGQCGRLHWR